MSRTLQDAFSDADGLICNSLLQSTDVSEKTWHDVALIADSDDQTFWTVVANHKNLPLALCNLVAAVDNMHSSVSRPRHRRRDEFALIKLVVRLATSTSVVLRVGVGVVDVAKRVGEVITSPLCLPMSLMILRHSGPIASVTITSLILINPGYLCAMVGVAASWCDATFRLAVRCVRDLARGRHQRLSGDVIPLFEQVYRHVKHLWSLLHCSPFLADYVPLSRMLQCLRVVVDLISPILQHFLLTCSTISGLREQLSKANSVIVNAAVNVASILVLYRTYKTTIGHHRSHCVERVVASYEAITSHITHKTRGIPALLLSDSRHSLVMILHELKPPLSDPDDLEIGKVLKGLNGAIPDSKDFADGFACSRSRYFELLLLELVHQGLHIDILLKNKFINSLEAEELGASERSITDAVAGIIERSAGQSAAAATAVTTANSGSKITSSPASTSVTLSEDPLVNIVLDVMPHFNVQGIKAALRYYNNDVEHFILDASMDNVTPDLLVQLTRMPPSSPFASNEVLAPQTAILGPAMTSSSAHFITSSDYDGELGEVDLNLLIGCDLYEAINGKNEVEHYEKSPTCDGYATLHTDNYDGGVGMFEVDESMREKIRMLTEMMYEDEYDDAQDAAEARGYEAQLGTDDSDSTSSDVAVDANKDDDGDANSGDPKRQPRTWYDEKKFGAAGSKWRETPPKSENASKGNAVAYEKKKKTTRKKTQDRMALSRAVRKGKTEW